ncbi:MAG TPA: RNA 2',3'-cyclic phosphodiesterase [Solirubrobacteraceae bacterium]|jgi:2'-5' RNA ligase|nr:RNA 2',3'-cyclic phosphodiesterase [Solirubrobacteraceae bacterium]
MTGERARLFVALELPDEARSELVAWRAGVVELTPAWRVVPAESLHVTLCFLGDVPAEAIAAIGAACSELVDRAYGDGIPLVLADPLRLPPRRPRVLTVAIADRDGRLAALQGELSAALARAGWYEPGARPFLAHVTVARVRAADRIRPLELEPPHAVAFTGSTVTLYRSRPGSRYEPLRRLSICA